MKFYNDPRDDIRYIFDEAKKGDRVAKKLLAYHKKKKREQKIKKLLAFDNHWSGLS
jgi:hypothetical protein